MDLFVNLSGLLLIAAIVWWFWLSRPGAAPAAPASQPVEIRVREGAYDPSRIRATRGRPLTLRFIREDPAPCAAVVLFPDLGISRELPMNRGVEITLTPERKGRFEFTCQMGMYRGELVIL